MIDDGSIDQSRRKYVRGPLEREHLDVDPIVQFQQWFQEAREHIDVEPNAMTLATVDSNGAPAARTVDHRIRPHASSSRHLVPADRRHLGRRVISGLSAISSFQLPDPSNSLVLHPDS